MSKRIGEIRAVREKTLSLLEPLSQQQMDRKEAPDRWSPGQVADHLVKSHRMYMAEIKKLIALKRAGREPEIRVRLSEMAFEVPFLPKFMLPLAEAPVSVFNYVMPAPLREMFLRSPIVPAQAPGVLRPTEGRPRDTLLQDLRDAMRETEELFVQNLDIDMTELRYYHPLFGFNGVDGILGLLASHEERHQKQLMKMLAVSPTR